ncbi:MAG TPA: DUF1259 domain-containing protein [Tepidisphaeraceae bacterium]|jgi:hypothetical protein|nr:DUF1259 domain-containing protein [Tepidisphaeraceae bacterium]
MILALGFIALTIFMAGCADLSTDPAPPHVAAAPAPAPSPGDSPATQPADPAWPDVAKALERPGIVKDGIDIFTIPRDDLDVTIDGMGIPTGAGIASVFYFYRCPCGKMNVAGQFVVADYEANDVVDALRKNAAMSVASVAPLLLYARPQLLVVRFQGEGEPAVMAGILREALRWTGKERMAPEPPPKSPGAE